MMNLYWHSLSFAHSHEYIYGNKKIIKAQPSKYGNRVPGLDMQWHSKSLWNIQDFFLRKCRLELSLPCANSYEQSQLQPKSLYCNQSWKNSITYAKYMWKICLQSPKELWKKKRFNLQAPPVYDRKVTNLFFSIIIVSIIICFHNSVGDCMSIDSQFEWILRGNIEL